MTDLEERLAAIEEEIKQIRQDAELHLQVHALSLPDPYPERRLPSYCWRSWPPRHTETCGCEVRDG